MPVKRDADGNIIEEKTRIGETFQQITPTIPGQSSAGDTVGPGQDRKPESDQKLGYDARTVLAGSTRGTEQQQDKDPKTRIYRPGKTERGAPTTAPDAGNTGCSVLGHGRPAGRLAGGDKRDRDRATLRPSATAPIRSGVMQRRPHTHRFRRRDHLPALPFHHHLRSPRQEVLPAARRGQEPDLPGGRPRAGAHRASRVFPYHYRQYRIVVRPPVL